MMEAVNPSLIERLRTVPPLRALTGVFLAIGLALAIPPMFLAFKKGPNKDYGRWYQVGCSVLEGGPVYFVPPDSPDQHVEFNYPPPAAGLLAALSLFGYVPMVAFLCVGNVIALPVTVRLAAELLDEPDERRRAIAAGVGGLAIIPYAAENFLLGQPNLFLAMLVLGAMLAVRRGRQTAAGLLLAPAIVIKAFPAVYLFWLLWRRQWIAAGVAVVTTASALLLFPGPGRDPQRNLDDLRTWHADMMGGYSQEALVAIKGSKSWNLSNQSMVAVFHRLLRPLQAGKAEEDTCYVNFADLSFAQVNALLVLAVAALGAVHLWRTWGRDIDAAECSMILLGVLMVTPYERTYYWIPFVLPLAAAVAEVLRRKAAGEPHQGLVANLLGVGVMLALTRLSDLPLPKLIRYWPQMAGNTFWATLWMFLLIAFAVKRRPKPLTPCSAP